MPLSFSWPCKRLTYLPAGPLPGVQQAVLPRGAPLPVVQAQAVKLRAGRGRQVEQGSAGKALNSLAQVGGPY